MTKPPAQSQPQEETRLLFDAHFHVIDPRFPLVPNEGFLPSPFTVADYQTRTSHLKVIGGVVVSGSFQGADQSYLFDALAQLGPTFVGVMNLPPDVTDSRLLELHAAGVRAVRVNLYRGGSDALTGLERLACEIFDTCGWHVEIYADGAQLVELEPILSRLPRVAIDHLGQSDKGLPVLRRLLEKGGYVKATGFGRVNLDVAATLRALVAVNPANVLFGTDLPSTRAPRPFDDGDISLIVETLGEDVAAKVLADNALALYRPAVTHDG